MCTAHLHVCDVMSMLLHDVCQLVYNSWSQQGGWATSMSCHAECKCVSSYWICLWVVYWNVGSSSLPLFPNTHIHTELHVIKILIKAYSYTIPQLLTMPTITLFSTVLLLELTLTSVHLYPTAYLFGITWTPLLCFHPLFRSLYRILEIFPTLVLYLCVMYTCLCPYCCCCCCCCCCYNYKFYKFNNNNNNNNDKLLIVL